MSQTAFTETIGTGRFAFTVHVDNGGWTVSSSDGTVVGRGMSPLTEFETAMSEIDSFMTFELVPLLEAAAAESAAKIGRLDARLFDWKSTENEGKENEG